MSKLSAKIAETVMRDLRGRSGILDDVEPDIQRDMKDELEARIQADIDEIVEGVQ